MKNLSYPLLIVLFSSAIMFKVFGLICGIMNDNLFEIKTCFLK
ncbi:hypothetical protein PBAL39_00215 [Pedobacter sp. BAL39]|nr:hypothetical protein PBAL39_00215 [Pedobacter sp. BAL39]